VIGAELTVSMEATVERERERDLLEELGENIKEMVVPPTSVPGKPVIGEVVDEKVDFTSELRNPHHVDAVPNPFP
jgi:hypothetical protein